MKPVRRWAIKTIQGITLVLLMMAAPAAVAESDPALTLDFFLQALKSGDSTSVDSLVSEEALSNVQAMLNSLEQSARSDPGGVTLRLTAAGYNSTADEIHDWDAREYLKRTVSLPVMMARYMSFEMVVGEPSYDRDRVRFPLTFTTSSDLTLETEAILDLEDDIWKVSSFMGLNSFP